MKIEDIETRLAEATDAELTEVLSAITADAKAVPAGNSTETVEALEKLAAAKAQVLAEQTRRQELASRADAARGAFAEEDTTDKDAEDAARAEAEKAAAEAAAEGTGVDGGEVAPAATETDAGGDASEGEGTVVASGKAPLGSIGKAVAKVNKAPSKFAGTVRGTTVATAASPTRPVGTTLDQEGLAESFAEQWSAISGARGAVGKHYVARVNTAYPEDRILTKDAGFGENARKIAKVNEPDALVAAGGFCAPLENLYDINVLGITARPVRDALSRFQVDRGGIQYRPPMDALAMTDGLGVWTAEMDAAVGVVETPTDIPDPTKTCAVIDCPDLEQAVVEAIYLCLQYPNFTARFDREWVDATTRAALIAHARFSENRLLAKLFAGSKRVTAPNQVSAVRDVLTNIDHVVAYYRNRHRLDTVSPLRMILPRWVLDLFRADICRSLGSAYDRAALGVADSEILSWFRNRGVNVTFHLDGLAAQDIAPTGAGAEDIPQQYYDNLAAGAVIPPFIDKIDSVLYAEGDWLFLDGGTLDLGLVRDSALNRINRYQTFVESWEGVAFNGIESLRMVMNVQPTGAVVGTIEPAIATFAGTD